MAFTGRLRDLMKKYGKVAVGVHCSISVASISTLYIAIKNNVDVEPVLEKFGLSTGPKEDEPSKPISSSSSETLHDFVVEEIEPPVEKKKNRTAELAASSGGAFAMALICNKALFPIRAPITVALTPPIARFLARRKILKDHA